MTNANIFPEQAFDVTDIFIVGDDHNVHDFVSVDETFTDLSDAVMIDMSHDETFGAVTIEIDHDSGFFVSLDHDVFVSDFTGDDFIHNIIDLDISDDIHLV